MRSVGILAAGEMDGVVPLVKRSTQRIFSQSWLLAIFLSVLVMIGTACNRPSHGSTVEMTLISNQENTLFEVRASGESEWRNIGKGKIIQTRVRRGIVYEVAATPDGYRRKMLVIPEPVKDLRFTFEKSDRESSATFELDVRVLDVATATVVASASDRAKEASDLRTSVDSCARKLTDLGRLKGLVAVVAFKDAGVGESMHYGEAAASMMISALEKSGSCTLVERTQLDNILAEHDLTAADIVRNPKLLGPVSEIQYVVVGTLSRMRQD
jgi:hypothetical protein